MKTVKERDDLDLLELVCELHSRSIMYMTKELHDASIEARQELESRIVAYQNFIKAHVIKSVCTCTTLTVPPQTINGVMTCMNCEKPMVQAVL